MQRTKRLTKRERKAISPGPKPPVEHIHCIACGRHLDREEFETSPPTAQVLTCKHQGTFPSCTGCVDRSQAMIDEHDRTGQDVKPKEAWH